VNDVIAGNVVAAVLVVIPIPVITEADMSLADVLHMMIIMIEERLLVLPIQTIAMTGVIVIAIVTVSVTAAGATLLTMLMIDVSTTTRVHLLAILMLGMHMMYHAVRIVNVNVNVAHTEGMLVVADCSVTDL